MTDDGQGRCFGRFTLPTLQGEMLKKQLMAIAAPKHRASTGGVEGQSDGASANDGTERLSWPSQLGRALVEWIERYPTNRLPNTGGIAATVVVTMSVETLIGGLAAASLDTGAVISSAAARRLACEAGIIPAVLGGASQVLDLGRQKRFHSGPQRIAMGLRDKGCTAEGCDWPPGRCHAHHDPPWTKGGVTSVEKADSSAHATTRWPTTPTTPVSREPAAGSPSPDARDSTCVAAYSRVMGHIDPTAWIAPSAVVTGDVTIGAGSRVLHGAVLNGDLGPIAVGSHVLVMEQALLRGRASHPVTVGDAVMIGPHTHLNGTTIDDEVFVATGVSMFPGSHAGTGSELRINSVLHVNSALAPKTVLPIGWIAAGDPAELFAPERHYDLWAVQEPFDFPGTVYGVPRGTSMREIMRRQCAAFGPQPDADGRRS